MILTPLLNPRWQKKNNQIVRWWEYAVEVRKWKTSYECAKRLVGWVFGEEGKDWSTWMFGSTPSVFRFGVSSFKFLDNPRFDTRIATLTLWDTSLHGRWLMEDREDVCTV